MKMKRGFILGLTLALAFTLTLGFPGGSPAQPSNSGASKPATGQDYRTGYYDSSNYYPGAYCSGSMGPGYGYYGSPRSGDYGSRSWSWGSCGPRGPINSGYTRGYRGGWGCW